MYDVVVIGAGPAGLAAALFAKRYGMNVLVLNNPEQTSNLAIAATVENYPGIEKISGMRLLDSMKTQVQNQGVEIKNESATTITKKILEIHKGFRYPKSSGISDKARFIVKTAKKTYESKAAILAMGMKNKKAGIKGEDEFLGKGVSYCVSCDAPLFEGKDVAIIGGGNSAVHGALVLKDIAKKVYIVHRRDEFRAEKALTDRIHGIELMMGFVPEEISGKEFVKSLKIKNMKTGKTRSINVNGIFIEIGYIPTTELVKNIGVLLDKNGFIITDAKKQTNVPGIFSAGDVSANTMKQITTAVSDGSIAAVSAFKYVRGE